MRRLKPLINDASRRSALLRRCHAHAGRENRVHQYRRLESEVCAIGLDDLADTVLRVMQRNALVENDGEARCGAEKACKCRGLQSSVRFTSNIRTAAFLNNALYPLKDVFHALCGLGVLRTT